MTIEKTAVQQQSSTPATNNTLSGQAAAKRHAELSELLGEASVHYHEQGDSQLDDENYDALMAELRSIEAAHPQLSANSISTQVGSSASSGANIKHLTPMLSLGNAFSTADLEAFVRKLAGKLASDAAGLDDAVFTVEYKLDGLSMNLIYDAGKLVSAATRGNGQSGEDITAQARMMNVPEKIQAGGQVEIRGEVYMPRSVMKAHNDAVLAGSARGRAFANTRNAAVGSLRKGTQERVSLLRFAVWGIGARGDLAIADQAEFLNWAVSQGFSVAPGTAAVQGIQAAGRAHAALEQARPSQDFDADGSVVKLADFAAQAEAGASSSAPAWAIAHKFQAVQVTTRLERVEVTTGRTGKLTPVACLTPVALEGSMVSRATLNNADYLAGLGVHEGDTLILQKAGGVIPQVTGVVLALRVPGAAAVTLPSSCPECGSPATRIEGEAGTFCRNPECPAQSEARLRHVVSSDVLNILGLGETVIEALHARGLRHFSELYSLSEKDLAELQVSAGQEGELTKKRALGVRTASKIIAEIERSKTGELWRFIRALGIPMTGHGTSTRLEEVYPSLRALSDAASAPGGEAVIAKVRDVGEKTAAAICNYFRTTGVGVLAALEAAGVSPIAGEKLQASDTLSGMSFVVTGTLSVGRGEIEAWLRQQGAAVGGSVTGKTTHLLAGEKAGSKLEKAEKLGVKVLSEADMPALCSARGTTWLS